MSEPDTETLDVAVRVLAVEHVHGRGRLLAMAAVLVEVGGLEISIHGIRLEAQGDGTVATCPPAYRHPASGRWLPSIGLPEPLRVGIAAEIAATIRAEGAR